MAAGYELEALGTLWLDVGKESVRYLLPRYRSQKRRSPRLRTLGHESGLCRILSLGELFIG